MHRLSTIALALGHERTRTELVPFLEEVSQEDEDEVLTVLAEQLGTFVPYIGGAEHVHILISTLEGLAAMEEPLVRDKAVESLNKLGETQSPELIEQYFLSLVKRLSSTEWFSSRVSATGLYQMCIAKAPPAFQEDLLSQYKVLCQDEAPMVRRAAATNLPKVIAAIPDVKFEGSLYSMFQSQVIDDQDSVRLLSVDVIIAIADALKAQQITKYNTELVTLAAALFTDKSWRVRYMAANRFEKLAVSLDSAEARAKFAPAFVNLMKDSEAEVRTAIAKQIPGVSALLSKEVILQEVIPNVELLSQDSSQYVRAALASEISRLAPLLGKDKTIEALLPSFLLMLKDEFPDVRLNIISKLHVVNDVIGIELLSKSLLPAISELAKDKQWRVRLAIIDYIPLLADQLGVAFFDRELGPLCMTWLWDNVYSIREAATLNLRKLTKVFGIEWAKEEIIPHIIVVGANTNYLYRLTALFAVTALIPVVDHDTMVESMMPFLGNLMTDPISNIRFNVAKSYKVLVQAYLKPEEDAAAETATKASSEAAPKAATEKDTAAAEDDDSEPTEQQHKKSKTQPAALTLGPHTDAATIKELIETTVVPNLQKLSEDPDVDVRYFANKALEEIELMVEKA